MCVHAYFHIFIHIIYIRYLAFHLSMRFVGRVGYMDLVLGYDEVLSCTGNMDLVTHEFAQFC